MHGEGMSNQVGKHSPFGQLGESLSSALDGKLQPFLDHDGIREREKLEAEQDTEEDPEK